MSVFGRGFFFLDVIVDHARHAAAAKAARRFVWGYAAFRIAHEAFVERFFRADKVVVVKSQLAALTALKILRHGFPLRVVCLNLPGRIRTNSGKVNNDWRTRG